MEEPTVKYLSANLKAQYSQIVTRQTTSVTANSQYVLLLYWLAKLPANIIAEEPAQKEHDENPLFIIQDTRATATNMDPIHVTMSLNGKSIPMEIDTGAAVSIMTETKFMEISSEEL